MNITDKQSFVLIFNMNILKTQNSKNKIKPNLVNMTLKIIKKPQNCISFETFDVFVRGISGQIQWEFLHQCCYSSTEHRNKISDI